MKKTIQTIFVLLGAVWLLPSAATAADQSDAKFEKEFPSLYRHIYPELVAKSRVASLSMALREAALSAEVFYNEHGRYPSTVSELMSDNHVEGADDFSWTIKPGSGQGSPSIRAVHRSDSRIEGVMSDMNLTLLDETKELEKSSNCNATRYMRDFLRDADAETSKRFLRELGAPDSVTPQDILNDMNTSLRRSCS